MIASADAGFENIWSLQDCIETLYEFGDEDQRSRFIPRVCAGETMSMDLTEPDAGSDLQRVMLKATYSEADIYEIPRPTKKMLSIIRMIMYIKCTNFCSK